MAFACPCGCGDMVGVSTGAAAAVELREWLDRRKFHPAGPPSPDTIREFEQCIDDLEAKHG